MNILFFIAILELILNIFSEEIAKFTITELNVNTKSPITGYGSTSPRSSTSTGPKSLLRTSWTECSTTPCFFIGETNQNQIFEEFININLRDQKSNLKIWILAFLIFILFNIIAVDLAVDCLMPINQRATGLTPLTRTGSDSQPRGRQAHHLRTMHCDQGGQSSKQISSIISW